MDINLVTLTKIELKKNIINIDKNILFSSFENHKYISEYKSINEIYVRDFFEEKYQTQNLGFLKVFRIGLDKNIKSKTISIYP